MMRSGMLATAAALFLLPPHGLSAQSEGRSARTLAFHGGFVIPEDEALYMDDPVDFWADRKLSLIGGVTLYFRKSESFMLGPYAELETIDYDVDSGLRLGAGLAFSGRHPAQGTALELGGTLGIARASLGDLDEQTGTDFSVFIGPVFQISPSMDLGIHLVGFYGWYGGGDVPEGVLNANARIRFQLTRRR